MDNNLSISNSFAVRLLRNLIVPTFVLDQEGKVLIWNKACEQLTGVNMATVIGTRDHWQAFYNEPRHCLADVVLKGNFNELSSLYDVTFSKENNDINVNVETWCEVPNKPGKFYLAIDAGPIYNERGDIIAVVETLRDLTDQKIAQDKLEKMAKADGLTALANRRAFDERLALNWAFAQRQQTEITLLFIDIDFFKQFNDSFGHQTGDDCLKKVATVLTSQVKRPNDLCARYGGEEFTVILPGLDEKSALCVAENIRQATMKLGIHHDKSPFSCVTVSIGLASVIPNKNDTIDAFVKIADQALYQAKEQSRNKVIVAKPNV